MMKAGTAGALLAAILCPICFPKLALVGALLGLGVLAPFEGWFAAAAQVSLVVALAGHAVAYRRHRNRWIAALAGAGVALVLGSLWFHYLEALVYLGLAGVLAATTWGAFALRRCDSCATATQTAAESAGSAGAAQHRGSAGSVAPDSLGLKFRGSTRGSSCRE
jgi:mercuric ion transport protein